MAALADVNLPYLRIPADASQSRQVASKGGSSATCTPRTLVNASPAQSNGAPSPARRRSLPATTDERRSEIEDPQDLGIVHKARMVKGSHFNPREGEPASPAIVSAAVEDYRSQEADVLKFMAIHLATVPHKAVLVEIGSRFGELASQVAGRFPCHDVLPTEGAGQTSPGLFMLLQEKVNIHNRDKSQRSSKHGGGRLLPPRKLHAGQLSSWTEHLGRSNVGCVFAVNVLHFVRDGTVETMLKGCKEVLRPGGIVLLCGPFFNYGEISESNLACHGALQAFADASFANHSREPLSWGLHDLQRVRDHAERAGLVFVEQRRVGLDWEALVLRQPQHATLPKRKKTVARSFNPYGPARRLSNH